MAVTAWETLRGRWNSTREPSARSRRSARPTLSGHLPGRASARQARTTLRHPPYAGTHLAPASHPSGFFPSSDRKTLIWENDYQESGIARQSGSARILASNLNQLPALMGSPRQGAAFWNECGRFTGWPSRRRARFGTVFSRSSGTRQSQRPRKPISFSRATTAGEVRAVHSHARGRRSLSALGRDAGFERCCRRAVEPSEQSAHDSRRQGAESFAACRDSHPGVAGSGRHGQRPGLAPLACESATPCRRD